MACTHRSIKSRHTGQQDNCILCGLDIIFDGHRWTWLHGLDKAKTKKLIRAFNVDRITGAHA